MRLEQLFTDDDAVSEVIGVVLMVAITVIIAAVIASFVLGLGGQSSDIAPQASFTADYSSGTWTADGTTWDGNLTVTHDSGDAIRTAEVYLRGSGFNASEDGSNSWENYNATQGSNAAYNASVSGSTGGQEAVVAGDRLRVGADSTYEMRLVWESTEGDSSNTLLEDDGPDA